MKKIKKINAKTMLWEGGSDLASRRRQIKRLIDLDQPFALARFRTGMILLPDYSEWTYELVLWQTRLDEESTPSLTMSRQTFNALIKEFGLQAGKKDKYGTVYVKDDTFNRLRNLFEEMTAAIEKDIQVIRESIARGRVAKDNLQAARDRIETLKKQKNEITETFYNEQDLIVFRFNADAALPRVTQHFDIASYAVVDGEAKFLNTHVAVKSGNGMSVSGIDKETFIEIMRTARTAIESHQYETLHGKITIVATPVMPSTTTRTAAIAAGYIISSGQKLPICGERTALFCDLDADGNAVTPEGAAAVAKKAFADGVTLLITTPDAESIINATEPDLDTIAVETLDDIMDVLAQDKPEEMKESA